jgi:cation diffusion facilitator family transporter
MHAHHIDDWRHTHSFGQERRRPGERRTLAVVVLNLLTMGAEVWAGLVFGSMALLADGLHMGSHTAALTLSFAAYVLSRRHAESPHFSFGTGKINALAGLVGALLLGLFAIGMLGGSVNRLVYPVPIEFDAALWVAVIGLAVNSASTLILSGALHGDDHSHHHGHDHHHHHDDRQHIHHQRGGDCADVHDDLALRSAYLHVLADAVTSVLAIVALLAGKYADASWLDPLIGMLGGTLVLRWAIGLARESGSVLLDRQAPPRLRDGVRRAVESVGDSVVADLHVWSIGPGINAAIVSVVTHEPRAPAAYKAAIPPELGVVHVTVEVEVCPGEAPCRERNAA